MKYCVFTSHVKFTFHVSHVKRETSRAAHNARFSHQTQKTSLSAGAFVGTQRSCPLTTRTQETKHFDEKMHHLNIFPLFVIAGEHPGRVVSGSYTDGELYHHSAGLTRGEEDLLSTPKRSLDRKILWMDGTMTLGRPRHIVQRSISGRWRHVCGCVCVFVSACVCMCVYANVCASVYVCPRFVCLSANARVWSAEPGARGCGLQDRKRGTKCE